MDIEPIVSPPRQEELDKLMQDEFMLTTLDNPFNPFTQWSDWFAFDAAQGYHTCSYLGRIAKTSHELSDADESLAISLAIDEIIEHNTTGLYVKVRREDFIDRSETVDVSTV